MIARLDGRDRAIVLLGGHLGLGPIEIRNVTWGALTDGHLTVGRAATKKTARRARTIAVPATQPERSRRGGYGQVAPPTHEPIIGVMTENATKLWGRRSLPPGVTLYTLRHSHASALHYAGCTLPEAARRLGHSQQMHIKAYAHVIDSISCQRYSDLDALITSARADAAKPGRALAR